MLKLFLCDELATGGNFAIVDNSKSPCFCWALTEGRQVIDHLKTYGVSTQHVAKKGQLPQGIGFASDHRGMFVDIHLEGLQGLIPDKPKERVPRRLKSGNQKITKEYIKNLKDKVVNQNEFNRISS